MTAFPAARASWNASDATVFIVDDDVAVRNSVSLLVRSVGFLAEAYASAQDFLDHYDPSKLGCLVLDARMPGMSGLELQRRLDSIATPPPIIFISAHGEIPLAAQAMRAGAVDFMQKPVSPEGLLERINEAVKLDLDSRHKRAQADEVKHRMTRLTDREREIMHLLAAGNSSKLIAQHLSINQKTVDNHRIKILEKMEADNATQLALLLVLLQ